MSIKILIADDDMLIRESLNIILGMEEDFEIMVCVENGLEAVEYCKKHEVDVALLDVRMPVMNGIEALKEIVKNTKTKTLILTTFDEDEHIMEALKSGAKGYLLKNNSPDKIKDAIKTVYGGNIVMQDIILDKFANGIADNKNKFKDDNLFTDREIEVIKSISEGLCNKDIAGKLFISEGTVKNYITSILSKTGLQHRTQIAVDYLKGNI